MYISSVFLRLLQSASTPTEHKLLVLEVFAVLCQDEASVIEMFLNYDCDPESINLYEHMVHSLSKIAQADLGAGTVNE